MILSLAPLKKELVDKIESETGETVKTGRPEAGEPLLGQTEIIFTPGGFPAELAEKAEKLRWLCSFSAGVEKLPFEMLARKGVTITNASGIHATQMAEQAIGSMIVFSRRLNDCIRNQQKKLWLRDHRYTELSGKTLLIIGAGSIGRETARKAKAFDMRVIGLKKHPGELADFDAVWGMERFHEALPLADYLLLLTPLTKETYHLFGSTEFSLMKPTAVFLNLSRGDNVDEQALTEALQGGKIAGAALDVFHEEPLNPESPLWEMENVLITPHSAGAVPDYDERAVELFLKSYPAYKKGAPLPNTVDPAAHY